MRHTIKITKEKAIDVQALNGRVSVVFLWNGAEAMRQEIERLPALLAASSLSVAARIAEENPAYETDRIATVKVAPGKYLCVWPSAGRVVINADVMGLTLATIDVDVNTAAALATAIELSSAEIGAGARCHGDQCAAGQIACPSPKACGVAE